VRDVSRLRITADKREIKDFLKLPSATSFIRKTLDAISGYFKVKNLWNSG